MAGAIVLRWRGNDTGLGIMAHTRINIRFVVLLAVFAAGLCAAPAWGATVSFFARNGGQEAVLSQLTTDPAALRVGDKTFIAYQGTGFDPYVAVYDSASETWAGPHRAGSNPLRLDAHGAPALYLDPANRLHAFYGAHATPLKHARSAPGSASSWSQLSTLGNATYPQVVDSGGGSMRLFYRNAAAHWVTRASSDGATTFGSEQTVLLSQDGLSQWYAGLRAGSDGRLDLAFTWMDRGLFDTGLWFVRRNAYYAYRDATGTWRGADDVALTLPIDLATANAHCRVFDSGSERVNEVVMREDSSGAPCLLFLTGIGSGPGTYDWRFMRKSGVSWTSRTITTTDHFYDAATFECLPDGRIDVFLVTGGSDAVGSVDNDYRGRGGNIERWSSADSGDTWSRVGRISPWETGVIYSDPVLVRDGGSDARVVFTEWTDDESNPFHRMFLWGDEGLVTRETDARVSRVAGRNRGLTSVEISKKAFPEGARYVLLATERDYIDALAGAPLASAVNGPILLTHPTMLPDEIADEIDRLGARNVIVLGGSDVVSDRVKAAALARSSVKSAERVGGDDRFDTALAIARRARDSSRRIRTALVVSGRNWPDAVAAGPLSVANDWPIVLADGNRLPAESQAVLREYGITSTVIVGQADVVGWSVQNVLPNPTRIGGTDRFDTAARLAEYGLTHGLLPDRALVATGLNFPDALAGSTLGGRSRAPVLFARQSDLTQPSRTYFAAHGNRTVDVWLLGESDVVGTAVEVEVEHRVGAD